MNVTVGDTFFAEHPSYGFVSLLYPAILACVVASSVVWYSLKTEFLPGIPIIKPSNGKLSAAAGWNVEGAQMLTRGLEKFPVFQVMTGTGPVAVLSNRFAHEVRNNKDLSFSKYFSKDFFVNYPGFEAYRRAHQDETFIREVVMTKLTQSLSFVTKDLVEEMTIVGREVIGNDPSFHPVVVKDLVDRTVSRLSSRVFLGADLAHDSRWLDIISHYTHDSYSAASELRSWPSILRPVAFWLLPKCKNLRKQVKDAIKLIMPEVKKRQQAVLKAQAEGTKPPKISDSLGWMYEISRGRILPGQDVEYVYAQLFLGFAAIHTSTETITRCLFDICVHPEVVQPLREEIIKIIGEHGWAKTSLYKLKLMDSFMKESQRMNCLTASSMHRYVERKVQLSDGTVLPKGARFFVTTESFWDSKIYPEPEKFDLYRFYNLRAQPGQEASAQYVATSPEYMLFGYGEHACPGRFFASNEMKIALCHFLLKYDFNFIEGEDFAPLQVESARITNPTAKFLIRRRKEEIDIDTVLEKAA